MIWEFDNRGGSARSSTPVSRLRPQQIAVMAFSTWLLSDQQVTTKGAKMSAITADGDRVFIVPSAEPLKMFFGPGNYDKTPAVKQNLDFRCTPQALELFAAMDAWLKDYILGNSELIFKRQLSADEIASGYHSCVSQRCSYDPTFRTKIKFHERGVTFWDPT